MLTKEEIEAARLQKEQEDAAAAAKDKMHTDKAFKEVSGDMHKYKAQAKELQDRLDKQDREKEDAARQAKESNNEYKELYEESQQEVKDLKGSIEEKNVSFLNVQKLSAVKDKLGGFKKSEYNKFIDMSRIMIDTDGNVDASTVENEVARLRKEYPELIKAKASSKLPDQAPESGDVNPPKVQKLTHDQRMELRRISIEERSK